MCRYHNDYAVIPLSHEVPYRGKLFHHRVYQNDVKVHDITSVLFCLTHCKYFIIMYSSLVSVGSSPLALNSTLQGTACMDQSCSWGPLISLAIHCTKK